MLAAHPEVLVATADEARVPSEFGVGTVHVPAHAKHGPGRRRSGGMAWLVAPSSGRIRESAPSRSPPLATGPTLKGSLGAPTRRRRIAVPATAMGTQVRGSAPAHGGRRAPASARRVLPRRRFPWQAPSAVEPPARPPGSMTSPAMLSLGPPWPSPSHERDRHRPPRASREGGEARAGLSRHVSKWRTGKGMILRKWRGHYI